LVVFGSYAVGMASVLMALAVGAALLRNGLARALKRLLPHMNRIAGALLLLVGRLSHVLLRCSSHRIVLGVLMALVGLTTVAGKHLSFSINHPFTS